MSGIVLFLALLVGGLISIGLLYSAYFALLNYAPSKGKVRNDLRKMKDEITPWVEELVPWNREELELLSSTAVNKKVKKGMVKTAKGIFNSIYHEPLIAFSFKKYLSKKDNSVLYARSSNHEFVYRTKRGKTELFIDNQKVGFINEKGLLYGNRRKRLLARINQDAHTLDLPIIIGDKEVGTLIKPNKDSVNPRAFQFVGKMDKNEEAVFLSLAVLELVKSSIDL